MDASVAGSRGRPALRFLCPKISLLSPPSDSLLRWLVGAPHVLSPFTVAAVLRPTHGDHAALDLPGEADEIRGLLPRGFDIVGALLVGGGGSDADVTRALEQARVLRELLFGVAASHGLVGGHMDAATGEIRFVVSESGGTDSVEGSVVTWEDEPGRLLWEKGCLLRCELPLKLPLYLRPDVNSGIEEQFSSLIESTVAKLRGPHVSYLVEGPITSSESHRSIILRGDDLSFDSHTHGNSRTNNCTKSIVSCSEFFTEKRYNLSLTRENADAIAITVIQSARSLKPGTTPVVEYFPGAPEGVTLLEFEPVIPEENQEQQEPEEPVGEGDVAEDLLECPDHRPATFLKDDMLYQGFCKTCLHPAGDDD